MNTGRNSKQTACLCRDTGGKGTLPAQRTGFNTLDNWGHKTPTQSKRKRDRKEKVKRSWPETCIQYTRLHTCIFCCGGGVGMEALFLAPMTITVDWTFRKIVVQFPRTTFYNIAVMSHFKRANARPETKINKSGRMQYKK